MQRTLRQFGLVVSGGALLFFGGCIAGALRDVFFVLGPLFL